MFISYLLKIVSSIQSLIKKYWELLILSKCIYLILNCYHIPLFSYPLIFWLTSMQFLDWGTLVERLFKYCLIFDLYLVYYWKWLLFGSVFLSLVNREKSLEPFLHSMMIVVSQRWFVSTRILCVSKEVSVDALSWCPRFVSPKFLGLHHASCAKLLIESTTKGWKIVEKYLNAVSRIEYKKELDMFFDISFSEIFHEDNSDFSSGCIYELCSKSIVS